MFGATLVWCVVQLAVDAATLHWCRRRRTPAPLAGMFVLASFIGVCTAWILGEDFFGKLRLTCWMLYGHGPCWLAAAAALLWRPHRRWAVGAGAAGVLLAAVAADAFIIEPRWLEVTHHTIASARVTERLRIVVLSDVQTDAVGAWESRVFAEAAAQQPDLVLWPGDYLQCMDRAALEARMPEWQAALAKSGLRPRLGGFAVTGDVDDKTDWPVLFDGTGVTCLPVTMRTTTGGVTIDALSLRDSRNPATRVRGDGVAGFHIAVGHAPDFALGPCDADLLIAGHTHGGQVRIPLFGPVLTLSRVPRDWAGGGLVTLPAGNHLIVSRGIGMERHYAPRLRFNCRPELVVIDVVPAGR